MYLWDVPKCITARWNIPGCLDRVNSSVCSTAICTTGREGKCHCERQNRMFETCISRGSCHNYLEIFI